MLETALSLLAADAAEAAAIRDLCRHPVDNRGPWAVVALTQDTRPQIAVMPETQVSNPDDVLMWQCPTELAATAIGQAFSRLTGWPLQ
jgi:hypothetical protein